ncbi:pyruvate dehydrogenase complex dihydrolipoamide acetyltransferase [Novosphingobium piscinae]|uniref:Acetyltransferase component of pyruvate dehydrogenase complex n=1 Tax=Novosphingobium piscinae TaxID=1507448 RepID=A0A7X1FYW0_9SPHN|nr:pyruvate dehydrogenase complex dihydrolipoamide acetyltransferase [Novosphingobium piscinae]MBC2669466.1 pyruvate dehydrogenase complex dihydrolipoamide acetyltransferase [Novosphingobium piscinae]
MPIEIKMPALSPTMEEGTLAKWLVKVGDKVGPGDILAEIETDKATMEYEAVDEGTIAAISVAAGTAGVKVGAVIATLAAEGEDAAAPSKPASPAPQPAAASAPAAAKAPAAAAAPVAAAPAAGGKRKAASPLARRLAAEKGIDLAGVTGTGPNGRIVRADVDAAKAGSAAAPTAAAPAKASASAPVAAPAPAAVAPAAASTAALLDDRIPHSIQKLSNMRKTIAKRLTQSMQQAPHIYLTVDVQLDKLLALRTELNAALEKDGVKLSVNDMLIKALGRALLRVPECNVTFAGDEMIRYERADISVAVSIPNGLITPIVQDASGRSLSSIATAMKDLGQRAKEGKLQPGEYQGGTASISNMGMMGIKHFTAVINPPQSTILAVGAGEKRPWVMGDGSLGVAQAMTVTGSFDHRAVDGADGARLMAAFRELVEAPLALLA